MQYKTSIILSITIFIYIAISPQLFALDLSTQDGLSLNLDNTSGQINGLRVNSQDIPLFPGIYGGLQFYAPIPITSQQTIFYEDFNAGEVTWNSAIMDNWESSTIYYNWVSNGGVNDSGYLRLGNGINTGCGIAFPQKINVSPGSSLKISWFGKSSNIESKYIFCIRLLNEDNIDITQQSPVSSGWIYSDASKAQCVYGMTNQVPNQWEEFAYNYSVPEDAVAMTISLRYWRDGDFYVNIDDLKIEETGGLNWGNKKNISGPLINTGENVYQQIVNFPVEKLKFTTTYTSFSNYLQTNVLIEDTSSPLQNRPLRILYTIPINAISWQWGDDINQHRLIESGKNYDYTFAMLGRKSSIYPWSSIYNNESGISMAVPMDVPRVQKFIYKNSEGLQSVFDICLSPDTVHIEAGKASLTFIIYQFTPQWGFRSATKKYYEIYPQFFTKRTLRDGCWEYPIAPTQIPNPQDFGFVFFETGLQPENVRNYCHQLGIEIYHYMEPWGAWQNYGDITEKPTYEERVATLEAWAADTSSTSTWLGAPRYQTAQAVLNSGYKDSSGKFYIDSSDYFWHQWGSNANQFWPCYPDADFSGISMGSIYKTYFVDYRADEKDGIYVDSISANGSLSDLEDYKQEHFKYAYQPLTFSIHNGQPIVASQMAQYDFLNWLYSYEHNQNKKVMGNIFVYGYRYYAHLLDILGSEIFDVRETDNISAIRRTLCYKKVNTNLMQWWRGDDFIDYNEVLQYIKEQLFWGFFPGIASCGGGIGWGETIQRYFLHPELYERDRDLFKTYIPIIRQLSEAGWEPLTFAQSDNSNILIERFGNWTSQNLLFTLKNNTVSTITTNITADAQSLDIKDSELNGVKCQEIISNLPISINVNEPSKQLGFTIDILSNDVKVISLYAPSAEVPFYFWELF